MKRVIPIFYAAALTVFVFWQFFVRGFVPMPGSFMVAWYEPWKMDNTKNGVPTIAHKAIGDDIFRQIIPFKMLAIQEMKLGGLPLWNPFGGAGQPLLANLHPGYLNPFSALLLLPKPFGWSWFVILQFPLLFLVTYWYTRKIGLQKLSGLFSSTVLVFSGVAVARYEYGDYIWALITLPILLGLIEEYKSKQWKPIFLGFPITIAFLLVSVQPQISIYIVLTVLLYSLFVIPACEPGSMVLKTGFRVKPGMTIGLLMFLGFGFASIQLFPTLELLQHANVTAGSSSFIFTKFLMPLSHLVTFIIPNYFGNPGTYNFWGKTDYVETVASIGSIPVFLALMSILHKKKNSIVSFFDWGTIITILLTLDWFGPKFLYQLPLPVLSTSIPTRIYVLTTFFLSILAGFGLEQAIQKKYVIKYWIILLGILLVSGFFYINQLPCPSVIPQCRSVALRTTIIELGVFVFFTGLFLLKRKRVFELGTLMLVVGIGFYNSQKFLPMSPAKYFMPDHPKLANLRHKPFVRTNTNVATDLSSYYGFFDPNYYDPLYIKRYGELVAYANGSKISRSDVQVSDNKRLRELLSIAPEGLPHAYMVYQYEVLPNPLERLFDPLFDATNSALLEEDIGKFTSGNSVVSVEQYGTTDVTIKVSTDQEGLLIFTDNYYHGWNAYLDGTKTKLYRANYTFRGVVVPNGSHTLEMVYEPMSIQYGRALTVVSMISWIGLLVYKRKTNM
jgi:hypothetical protein